jgi:hypothetical protein
VVAGHVEDASELLENIDIAKAAEVNEIPFKSRDFH